MHTSDRAFKKRFVIVSGPVSSGKTTLALNIAHNRTGCFYFDKDDLVITSMATFRAAYELVPENVEIPFDRKTLAEFDRKSPFFKKYIRNPEYESSRDILIKGLQFNDFVIVNAPYNSELNAEAKGDCPMFDQFRKIFDKEDCEFIVVYVHITQEELCRRLGSRLMNDRPAAYRTPEVYGDTAHLDAYYKAIDAGELKLDYESIPAEIKEFIAAYALKQPTEAPDLTNGKNVDNLFVFDADNDALRDASYVRLMAELGIESYEPYNRKLPVNTVE